MWQPKIFREHEQSKVGGIERAVRQHWREQALGFFIQPRQRQRKHEQRQKNRRAAVDGREQNAGRQPRAFRPAEFFDA